MTVVNELASSEGDPKGPAPKAWSPSASSTNNGHLRGGDEVGQSSDLFDRFTYDHDRTAPCVVCKQVTPCIRLDDRVFLHLVCEPKLAAP